MRRFLLATLFASVSAAALAETPASCSMAGLTGWPHPADLEALPRADWPKPKGGEICSDAGTSVRKIGDKAFRFAFATIRMPGATERIGAFVAISRIDGDADVPLGRFVLPLALVEGRSGAHGVQVIAEGGTVFARLARTETELFAIPVTRSSPAERGLVRRPDPLPAGERGDRADPEFRSRGHDGLCRRP